MDARHFSSHRRISNGKIPKNPQLEVANESKHQFSFSKKRKTNVPWKRLRWKNQSAKTNIRDGRTMHEISSRYSNQRKMAENSPKPIRLFHFWDEWHRLYCLRTLNDYSIFHQQRQKSLKFHTEMVFAQKFLIDIQRTD